MSSPVRESISKLRCAGQYLEIVAKDWQTYLVSRLFAGIGTGMVQSTITVYIGEIASVQAFRTSR